VKKPIIEFPQVRFVPGDQVRVTAGGCVQTGGSGKTWKRYLDPLPESDQRYHGMILIPGAIGNLPANDLNRFARILIEKGTTFVVKPIAEPGKQHLWLGYEDDDYGDNGYWGQDEGTQGQCRIGNGWVEHAFVVVTITHGVLAPKAMDVVWSKDLADDNGFARNPLWYQMTQTGQPPNPCAFCPCQNEDPQAWQAAANCTNQALHFNSSDFCSGHLNWLPVEYEGTITWAEHSKGLFDDDDYFYYLKRSDQSIKTAAPGDARDGVEIEFDAGETVDYWDDTHTWWEDFHKAVDSTDGKTGGPAGSMIDGHEVIIIGLLGLDTQHTVHSELHPVYAMFVRIPQQLATQDRWAFFVRNWGNEGGCGSDQEPLRQNTIQVRIPHARGTGFALSDNVWVYGDDESEFNQESWSYQPVADGVLLTFHLRDPEKQVGFMGDLTINWGVPGRSPAVAAPQTKISRAVRAADEDEDMMLKSKIAKLDPSAQQLLYKEVKNLAHHPKSQIKRGTMNLSPVPERLKPTGPFPNYGAIVKSVADPARRAQRTRQREFILSFLKARGIG
jgi:hypothetical protein